MKQPTKSKRKLHPDDVRDVALWLCHELGNEGLSLYKLCHCLEQEGYRVHHTFCAGALMKKGSGFIIQDEKFWLAKPVLVAGTTEQKRKLEDKREPKRKAV